MSTVTVLDSVINVVDCVADLIISIVICIHCVFITFIKLFDKEEQVLNVLSETSIVYGTPTNKSESNDNQQHTLSIDDDVVCVALYYSSDDDDTLSLCSQEEY